MADGTLSGGTVSLPVKPATAGFGGLLETGIMAESGGLGSLGLRLGGVILGGIAALGIGRKIGEFIGTGIREYSDAENATAQLNAGLISTGNVAGLNVKSMTDLAASIQAYSGQTDDSIMKTEQILQTFTNIRNVGADKIFDRTTKAAADMAAKLGGDASSQAIVLGKALNDPIAGMTALTRKGVQFTDAQKDQIQTMVDAGDTMGAQKIILGELERQMGGAAAAAGQTLGGTFERLKRTGEDLAQSVLGTILPAVQPLVDKIVTGSQQLQNSPGFQKFLDGLTTFAQNEAGKLGELFDVILSVFNSDSKNPLGDMVTELAKVNPLFTVLKTIVDALQPIMPQIFDAFAKIGPALAPALPVLADLIVQLLPGMVSLLLALLPLVPPLVNLLIDLAPVIIAVVNALIPLINLNADIMTFFSAIVAGMLAGKTSSEDFLAVIGQAPASILAMFNGVAGFIYGIANAAIDAMNGLMSIIPGFVNMISDALGIGVHVSSVRIPHVGGTISMTVDTSATSTAIGSMKRAAAGGTFMPQPGGHIVNLAEAGRAETVVDTATLQAAMANRGGAQTINVYEATNAWATAMQVARMNNSLAAA